VILRASIEGTTFHRSAVAELVPDDLRPALGARLMTLVRKDLIRPDRSDFPGDDGFRFGHALIRDAAYEAAPKALRAEAHQSCAMWLDRRAGERVMQYEEIVGHHLEQAQRYRAELGLEDLGLAADAGKRLARAGQRALARGDMPAAVNLLERSAALLDDAPPGLFESLGIARMEVGDLDGADQALTAAIEEAEGHSDQPVARAALTRLQLRLLTGRTSAAQLKAEAERLIPELERLEDDAGLARAWLLMADVHAFFSEMAGLEQAAGQAVVYARRAGDGRQEAEALFWECNGALYGQRRVEDGIALCQRLLEESSGPMAEAGLVEILAAFRLRNGEVAEGRELYRRSDQLYRDLGMRFRAVINLQCQGTSELAIGEPEAAETVLRRAIEEFEGMGERATSSTAAALLGHALCGLGRYEEAEVWLETSEQLTAPNDSWNLALIPSGRARIFGALGEGSAALALVRQALGVAAELDAPEIHALALVALAEVHRGAGEHAEEEAALRHAVSLYERKGNRPATERLRARAEELAALSAS
jgi:tetratricopeptide (TPR) repeat protein